MGVNRGLRSLGDSSLKEEGLVKSRLASESVKQNLRQDPKCCLEVFPITTFAASPAQKHLARILNPLQTLICDQDTLSVSYSDLYPAASGSGANIARQFRSILRRISNTMNNQPAQDDGNLSRPPSQGTQVFGDKFYINVTQPTDNNLTIRVILWSEGLPGEASRNVDKYYAAITKNPQSVKVLNIHVENRAPAEVDSWATIRALHNTLDGLLPELKVVRLAVHHWPSTTDQIHNGVAPFPPFRSAEFHRCPFDSLFDLPMLQTIKGYRLIVKNLGWRYGYGPEETWFQNTKELGVLFATDGASANNQLWGKHELCVLFPYVAWNLPGDIQLPSELHFSMSLLVNNFREWNELRKFDVGMKGWNKRMLDEY